jgi:putative endonuclease
MFFYTYVLLDKGNCFYIGFTYDLKNRLVEHKLGKVLSTKNKLPVKLIYYEACINKYDAVKRERYLKSGPGKKYLKHRLKRFLEPRPVRSLVRGFRSKVSLVVK